MALVATNIGGGLLGFPYAFYHAGIFNAIIMMFFFAACGHLSVYIYLKTKDLTPRKYESTYEIAYLLFGRVSIFIVTGTLWAFGLGMMVMYYMILGETVGHLFAQFFVKNHNGQTL